MPKKSLNMRYASIAFILLFGMACNALLPLATPTPVPTDTPTPTATVTATPTATPTSTPTPLPDYNGVWEGTTSQDKPISITVEKNSVVSVEIKLEMAGVGCTTTFSGTVALNAPIVADAFDTTADVFQGTFAIHGTFDSEESVSGTFVYTGEKGSMGVPGCVGVKEAEWSATKSSSE